MIIKTEIPELIIQLRFDETGVGFNHDTILVENLKEVFGMEEPETLEAR